MTEYFKWPIILLTVGLILYAVFATGCAGKQLKKCSDDIPGDIMYCPDHVDGDFWMCKGTSHVLRCEDPK